jgi:hypothetical protein
LWRTRRHDYTRESGGAMRLNRRGRIVRALLIGAGIALGLWVAGNVWYTPTGGCIGSMSECVGL